MAGRMMWLCFVAGAIQLLIHRGGWCDEPATAEGAAEGPRLLVSRLNDDEYAVRERAAQRLTELGPAAIEALVEGIGSDQAEVAWRCGAALEQIALEADEQTIDRIVKQLDALRAASGRDGIKSLTADLYARQKQYRRNRAISQIRKHGGQIAGTGIEGEIDAMMMPMVGPAIVFDGPFAAVDIAVEAMPVPAPEPVELPRAEAFDLFAEVGRALGRAIAPRDAKPAAKEFRLDKEAAKDEAIAEAKSDEAFKELEKAVAEAKEAAAAAKADAAKADASKAAAAEGKHVDPAPKAEVAIDAVPLEVIEAVPALADVRIVEVAMAADAVWSPESGWAQLTLDQNWQGGDAGLLVLKDLPELAQISLQQSRLTDKSLVHLALLPNLRQLNLYNSGLSRDGLLGFHRLRPNVVIYARGDALMGVHADFSSSPLMLTSIYDGSGAAKAGLQAGDIIHQIDGLKIRDFSDLTICVSSMKPGDKIDVQFERGGQKQTVQVELARRTAED